MKRVFVILAAVIAVSLSSCKKEYTCECATPAIFEDEEDEEMFPPRTYTYKETKKKAKEKCEENNQEFFGIIVYECKIK